MTREIKFRAWEKRMEEMIAVSNIDFSKRMVNTESAWRLFDEIELMQYTGLKDKNGVEIYEGDIVTLPFGKGYECMKAEIVRGFCGWEFRWLDKQTTAVRRKESEPIFQNVEFFEVIGNIYEHPELLQQVKATP